MKDHLLHRCPLHLFLVGIVTSIVLTACNDDNKSSNNNNQNGNKKPPVMDCAPK